MLQARPRFVLRFFAIAFVSVVAVAPNARALVANQFPAPAINEFIVMPDSQGHEAFLAGINGAQRSIDLAMYHLTDQQVINALIAKATSTHIPIRIILDGKSLQGPFGQQTLGALKAAGIDARPSSPAFSIMHQKSMIIDNQYAFITSINLTNTATTSRDYGIITNDPGIIAEMDGVFAADLLNAANGTGLTPNVTNPNLIWSPVNSEPKLVTLINDAQATLLVTVESITDNTIIGALGLAAARGVQVFVLVPECNEGDALLNYPALATLAANHVNVRVMPAPGRPDQPYMHAKTIVADGQLVYIGSVNYSWNSTQKARELGIIFYNRTVAQQLGADYQLDWHRSILPPANPSLQMCQTADPDHFPAQPTRSTAPASLRK